MKKIFVIVFVILILSFLSCKKRVPNISPENTATTTSTNIFTYTITPTFSDTSTITASFTMSITSTNTFTSTITETHTISPTFTQTPTATKDIIVNAQIMRDYNENIKYEVYIARQSTPQVDATVIVTDLGTSINYYLNYNSGLLSYVLYQPDAVYIPLNSYRVTIYQAGDTFIDEGIAPDIATVSSDGRIIDWQPSGINWQPPSSGDSDIEIDVESLAPTYIIAGPLTPPYTLPVSVYSVPGSYDVYVFMRNWYRIAFGLSYNKGQLMISNIKHASVQINTPTPTATITATP